MPSDSVTVPADHCIEAISDSLAARNLSARSSLSSSHTILSIGSATALMQPASISSCVLFDACFDALRRTRLNQIAAGYFVCYDAINIARWVGGMLEVLYDRLLAFYVCGLALCDWERFQQKTCRLHHSLPRQSRDQRPGAPTPFLP